MRNNQFSPLHYAAGAIVLGGLMLAGLAADFEPGELSTGVSTIASYRVSTSPSDEILNYSVSGGLGFLVPEYRLYGDGRLVREVIDQGNRESVTREERQLSAEDVEVLFRLAVESRLAELTPNRLRATVGVTPLREDSTSVVLRLRFESYQRVGEPEIAPFEPQIIMETPSVVTRSFPQFREGQALVALTEALEAYFGQTSAQAVNEAYQSRSNP